MLTKAGQAEILRAAQRDDTFKTHLQELVSELLHSLFGVRIWLRYKDVAKVATNVGYQALTTLSRLQTLGEEYTGIVQVNRSSEKLPTRHAQLLMILLDSCGEQLIIKILDASVRYLESLPVDHPMRKEARIQFIQLAKNVKKAIPIIKQIHRAAFYLHGSYYSISKRTTGIRYALVRYWLKDRASLPTFKYLGYISSAHLLLYTLLGIFKLNKLIESESETSRNVVSESLIDNREKCVLCLNIRENTSATPCGHLFCWNCIITWLQTQQFCPLCRQTVQPSRVIYLQNYERNKVR